VKLEIPGPLLSQIQAHGEAHYPEEGAGFLLGRAQGEVRRVRGLLPLTNARETAARRNRYLIGPQDLLQGEQEAERQGLELIGVFHSHPDHPALPSEFDRQWALPWFSYLITSVRASKAAESRSWRLDEDRQGFTEEQIDRILASHG
jgi:proteasome lid subunit RPN8/RPN11